MLRYYEHISYAFDNATHLAGMAMTPGMPYLNHSESRKRFFVTYGHLHENLQRADKLRGFPPEIRKGKYPKNSKYDEFLRTWPRNPGTTFGLDIVADSALEAAYTIVVRIEGAILSAQERAMGRGQGNQFDDLSIDDARVGSWLSGVFTDEIRRLLGLPDSIQILMGHPDRWTLQELNRDSSALISKLCGEKYVFLKAMSSRSKIISESMPDKDEYVTLIKFMERHCNYYKGIDYKARRDAIYKAEKKGIIKLPISVTARTERKAIRFAVSKLRLVWGTISKHVDIPSLKA
jgi:hypothetical protein